MVRTIIPPRVFYNAILDGRAYFVNTLLTVPADGSANVHLENPDSDKDLWLLDINVIVDGGTEVWIHDSFDSLSNGTEISAQNALLDSGGGPPDGGDFNAYEDANFTESGNGSYPVGITSGDGPPTTTSVAVPSMAVEVGRNLVLEVEDVESTEQRAIAALLVMETH